MALMATAIYWAGTPSPFLPIRDLWMWGMTPPPAMVALIRVSNSSSPVMGKYLASSQKRFNNFFPLHIKWYSLNFEWDIYCFKFIFSIFDSWFEIVSIPPVIISPKMSSLRTANNWREQKYPGKHQNVF